MTQLFAQPYDISATGFYFKTAEQFSQLVEKAVNEHGDPVEEFEIQFIDGDDINVDLAKAWHLNQANLGAFVDAASDWEEHQKLHYIIAVGECGYSHEQAVNDSDDIEIEIYRFRHMKELAEQFVDDGLYGVIPATLENYIDYERIALDLEVEYSTVRIAGEWLIFYCR